MPLTLNVGLSKKIGQPDYGSLGAACNITVELDGTLLQHDLDTFQQKVRDAYVACHQAIEDELARHQQQLPAGRLPLVEPVIPHTTPHTTPNSTGNGHNGNSRIAPQNGNGTNGHTASEKQLAYVNQLARQIRGLGVRRVDEVCGRMFNKPLVDISSLEASSLIDTFKAVKDGQINVDDMFGRAGACSVAPRPRPRRAA